MWERFKDRFFGPKKNKLEERIEDYMARAQTSNIPPYFLEASVVVSKEGGALEQERMAERLLPGLFSDNNQAASAVIYATAIASIQHYDLVVRYAERHEKD